MSVGIICDSCGAGTLDFKIPVTRQDNGFSVRIDMQRKASQKVIVSPDLCRRCFCEMIYRLLLNSVPDGVHIDWQESAVRTKIYQSEADDPK